MLQPLLNFCNNAPLMFAAGIALFNGQHGGLQLQVTLLGFVLVVLCRLAATTQLIKFFGRFMARASTPQYILGIMNYVLIGIILNSKPLNMLTLHDVAFICMLFIFSLSSFCLGRKLQYGFVVNKITFGVVLLMPYTWGLLGNVISAFYNSPITALALPLLFVSVWVAVTGKLGRWIMPRTLPDYLYIAFNSWYALCNIFGDNPNILVVTACGFFCLGGYMVAQRVKADYGRALADQFYVELPGLSVNSRKFGVGNYVDPVLAGGRLPY